MSPNQVAKKLSISKAAAQQTMNDFFRRFRRVKSWMEEIKQGARRNGYVLTIAGRRRYLNDIRSDDNGKRIQAEERQVINTVNQGSAADLMKTAMIQLSENLQSSWQEEGMTAVGEFSESTSAAIRSPRPQMVLQIHDEVLLELQFKEEDIKQLQAIALKSCCRDCEELFFRRRCCLKHHARRMAECQDMDCKTISTAFDAIVVNEQEIMPTLHPDHYDIMTLSFSSVMDIQIQIE